LTADVVCGNELANMSANTMPNNLEGREAACSMKTFFFFGITSFALQSPVLGKTPKMEMAAAHFRHRIQQTHQKTASSSATVP